MSRAFEEYREYLALNKPEEYDQLFSDSHMDQLTKMHEERVRQFVDNNRKEE